MSATPAAHSSKKLIPERTPMGATNASEMIKPKKKRRPNGDRSRSSSIITGPKHLNPEFAGKDQKLTMG